MFEKRFEKLLKNDRYQVFLFTCAATIPFHIARHPWFVINKKGAISRWEVKWWRDWRKERPTYVSKDSYGPFQGIEMFYYPNNIYWPLVRLEGVIEGDEGSLAQQMADFIEESDERYPFADTYVLRGPNSNTYVQWVLDQFPRSNLKLGWNSFGKEFKT